MISSTLALKSAQKKQRHLHLIAVTFSLAICFLFSSMYPIELRAQDNSVVDQEVRDFLMQGQEAPVMISLKRPGSLAPDNFNLDVLRSEVAVLQQSVLEDLDSGEFRLRHQYRALPAVSGHILTLDALDKLAARDNVVRIEFDRAGGGHLLDSVPLIGANEWHDADILGDGIVVAVLDSGIDSDHSDLGDAPHS